MSDFLDMVKNSAKPFKKTLDPELESKYSGDVKETTPPWEYAAGAYGIGKAGATIAGKIGGAMAKKKFENLPGKVLEGLKGKQRADIHQTRLEAETSGVPKWW